MDRTSAPIGKKISRFFQIPIKTIENTLREKPSGFYSGTYLVKKGVITLAQLLTYLSYIDEDLELPLSYTKSFDDSVDDETLAELEKKGFFLLGKRKDHLVFASPTLPPEPVRSFLEKHFRHPVTFFIPGPRQWEEILSYRTSKNLPHIHKNFLQGIPHIELDKKKGHPLLRMVKELFHRKRTILSIIQQGKNAWFDYHTPRIPLHPVSPALVEDLIEWENVDEKFFQTFSLPERIQVYQIHSGKKKLHIFLENKPAHERNRLHLRIFHLTHWTTKLNESKSWVEGGKALLNWLSTHEPGTWLFIGAPSPLKWMSLLSLLETIRNEFPNLYFITLGERLGKIAPYVRSYSWPPPQPDIMKEYTPRLYIIECEFQPQSIQNALLYDHEHPRILLLPTPTEMTAFSTLAKIGLRSAFHARQIRGWTSMIGVLQACDWCKHPFALPTNIFSQDIFTLFRLPSELPLYRGSGCSACQDSASFQFEEPLVGSGFLPVTKIKQPLLEFIQQGRIAFSWEELIEKKHISRVDGFWVLHLFKSVDASLAELLQ